MVSIGGTGWMLLFAAVAGLFALVIGLAVGRRMGAVAGVAWFGLLWSIAVIAIVTLVPAQNGLGYIPADEHATSCSWDIGGPAPGGFWIFGGGQQLLNTLLFVPAGIFLVLAFGTVAGSAGCWCRSGWSRSRRTPSASRRSSSTSRASTARATSPTSSTTSRGPPSASRSVSRCCRWSVPGGPRPGHEPEIGLAP